MKDFYELFIKELKDIYNAERQIVHALPEMAKRAHAANLKHALHGHLQESKKQVERLKKIAKEINEDLKGPENEVIKSLIREGQKIMKTHYDPVVKDAALINLIQHIKHYEIASYGSLKAFAKQLKLPHVHKLFYESSKEEGHANKSLTAIAEGHFFKVGINDKACKKCA